MAIDQEVKSKPETPKPVAKVPKRKRVKVLEKTITQKSKEELKHVRYDNHQRSQKVDPLTGSVIKSKKFKLNLI